MIDPPQAMRQAMMTAHDYMRNAKHDIDEIFGPDTAIENPELVAAYMNAAAIDYLAYTVLRIAENMGPSP